MWIWMQPPGRSFVYTVIDDFKVRAIAAQAGTPGTT